MSDKTGIEWTDSTWNPIRGCSFVSEGCRNCYAEKMAARFSGPGLPYEGVVNRDGKWNGTIKLIEEKLTEPLHWKKPRKIFVNSMSDLFHKNVPGEFIKRVLDIIEKCPQHTFQILTKRPERMQQVMEHWCAYPYPNLWLGVSVEDQKTTDERIPYLLRTPAAIRFVSCEPLLGPIHLGKVPGFNLSGQAGIDLLRNFWVIVGGESGPGARPMKPDWAQSLRNQCEATGVPFFFKQWGEYVTPLQMTEDAFRDFDAAENAAGHPGLNIPRRMGKKDAGRMLDEREWNEFPKAVEK